MSIYEAYELPAKRENAAIYYATEIASEEEKNHKSLMTLNRVEVVNNILHFILRKAFDLISQFHRMGEQASLCLSLSVFVAHPSIRSS